MAAHRPGKVVFPDKAMAAALHDSFKVLNIECTVLSESEGVNEHVANFSSFLIRKDMAAAGAASEKPGLLANPTVTEPMVARIFDAAAAYFEAEPWKKLNERQAFSLTLPDPTPTKPAKAKKGGAKGAAAAAAAAEEEKGPKTRTVWCTVMGMSGPVGIGLFYHRWDMEQRVLPRGTQSARIALAKPCCSFTGRTEEELGHKLKRTRPRTFDSRTGLELIYADADSQRSHWKGVKKYSKDLSLRGQEGEEVVWSDVECSLMFEGPTALPFDDHDSIDRHDWRRATNSVGKGSSHAYPLPLQVQC
jgi:hypothetical protein